MPTLRPRKIAQPRTEFAIERWRAWTPDLRDEEDWEAWLDGVRRDGPNAVPDVGFLPALLRRRLDLAGRMALAVAGRCLPENRPMPAIFASRHGGVNRTLALLESIARDEPLSPTAFSLSVHNSVIGLFSIARGDRSPNTSVAAGPDTLAAAFWEAASQLADGAERVLIVYVSEPVPETYRPFLGGDAPAFSFAAVLSSDGAGAPRFDLTAGEDTPSAQPSRERALIELMVGRIRHAGLSDRGAGLRLARSGSND
jgi:Beta-ketoacyl synthase, N-terminal domain